MAISNNIEVSIVSKDTATVSLGISADSSANTTALSPDSAPVISFIATGPQGPPGTNAVVSDGGIGTPQIQGLSITTEKVADSAITNSKLGNYAVSAGKMGSNAVTTAKIAADAVTGAKIADNAIGPEHIGDGVIAKELLGSGIIDNSKLEDLIISTSKLQNGAVTGVKIQTDPTLSGKVTANNYKATGSSPASVEGPDTDDLIIKSNEDLIFIVDNNQGVTANNSSFIFKNGSGTQIAALDESGNLTISGTVDGRDVAADGTALDGLSGSGAIDWTTDQGGTNIHAGNYTDTNTTYSEATGSAEGLMSIAHHDKLDGIETSADVTDATNVTAAGALMDSELTDLAGVKGVTISTLQPRPSEGAFDNGDKTKLDAIEASADVTDTTNVTAAGALMDSELTDLAGVKGVTISLLQVKPSEGAFASGDKTKLDTIASGAEVNVQSDWNSSSGDSKILNKPTIPVDLTVDGAGTVHSNNYTDTNTTYSEATGSAEGLMSIAHHDKLDGIASGATAYVDANAVSAVAAADDYLKNDAADTISGDLTIGSDYLYLKDQSGSLAASRLTTATLTGNRTLTMPDATGIIATTNVHHHFLNAGFFMSFPYARYIPLNGSLNEQNTATSSPEYVNFTFPYDGYVKKMVLRSETDMGSTNLKLYKGASGSAVSTVLGDVDATVGASAAVVFDFTSVSNAYSKGDTMAVKVDPTADPDGGQNITIELVFDLTT